MSGDCEGGGKSTIVVRHDEGLASKASIRWKIVGGPEIVAADLGDPAATTPYRLCVFRETTDVEKRFVAELTFGPSNAWTVDTKGAIYDDDAGSDGGVTAAQIRIGADGRSKISISAGGDNLPWIEHFDDEHLFEPGKGLAAQLHNLESGQCWTATFPTLRKNSAAAAKARIP
jgi:hypothetical protein